MRLLSGVH